MKEYSEKIFNQIQKIEEEIKNIYIPNSQKEKIKTIEKILNAKALEEIEMIEDEEFKQEIKIKTIALKLNNFDFEQMITTISHLKKRKEELELVENQIEETIKQIENKRKKQKLLEFVYDFGIPIEDQEIIEQIIEQYKKEQENPTEILKIIIEENIKSYTKEPEKEEYLTDKKMNKLSLEEDEQQLIKEVKKIVFEYQNVQGNINMVDYLLSISEEMLLETLENDIQYKEPLLLSIMKSLLDKINNNDGIEKSIDLLSIIYETYKEKTVEEPQNSTKKKLLFLKKPASNDLYIYDDISKIESKEYLRLIEKEFKKLINGDILGKSLTGLPENLFEKKAYKTRITYKILPSNYILILNCYIKGNKQAQNIRELIEKPSISYQIHLYDALATENPEVIEQIINKGKIKSISKQEQESYVINFVQSDKIDILQQFQEGEKNEKTNRPSN